MMKKSYSNTQVGVFVFISLVLLLLQVVVCLYIQAIWSKRLWPDTIFTLFKCAFSCGVITTCSVFWVCFLISIKIK